MHTDRGKVIVYKAEDGKFAIDVRLADETIWLTHEEMATLLQRERSVVT